MRILDDLSAFIQRHGPGAAQELPLLNWSLGGHYALIAELREGESSLETLRAYATALGVEVHERAKPQRTVYSVRGTIPPASVERGEPHSSVLIQLTVHDNLDNANGGTPMDERVTVHGQDGDAR
ncbi:MAG TPA: hypothetical protein VGS97_14015 [Actinocrinis sp.]|nr:hypothetical protein [Actinocrinis sp.]